MFSLPGAPNNLIRPCFCYLNVHKHRLKLRKYSHFSDIPATYWVKKAHFQALC